SYRVWGWPGSVREAAVGSEWAVLNGAAVFVVANDGPYTVVVERPPEWPRAITPLPGDGDTFHAADLDTLFDSPWLVGDPQVVAGQVGGAPFDTVVLGEPATFDPARAAADAARVAEAVAREWGGVPWPRYDLLVWVGDRGGGGLEHANGALLTAPRWADDAEHRRFAALAAHEIAHGWNGKRLRPAGLGPFDYRREVYTPSLWVVEGVTSYLGDLAVARSGAGDEAELLAALSRAVTGVQSAPGRRVESLAAASTDAWIGEYKPDADTPNRDTSYYRKGEVVAFLLDAEIRRATADRQTIHDWLRLALEQFGDRGYEEPELRALASEVAGRDLGPFFARAVDSTDELDYGGALNWFGLRWAEPGPPVASLGCEVDGRLGVVAVRDDTPAARAGLAVGDELVALGGFRLSSDGLTAAIEQLGVGYTGPLTVARGGRMHELTVTLDARPRGWTLEPDPAASPIAHRRRERWSR
ncbi:MAG: PDZ domain-containing protein, partial [Myxococcota bacterium]